MPEDVPILALAQLKCQTSSATTPHTAGAAYAAWPQRLESRASSLLELLR